MPRFRRSLRIALPLAVLLAAGGRVAAQAPRMYLTNQDDATVSVIDPASRTVVATVDFQALGFGPTAKPHHTQVEPDGSYWYVSLIGAGKVLKLDRENHIVGSVELQVPGLLALQPAGDLLLAARSMSAVNPPPRLAVIRRSDMTLVDEVEVLFPRPHAIAIDRRGRYAYVASLGVNQLAAVRLEDGRVTLADVPGPYHTLTQFSVSPDGRWLLATGSTSGQVLVFDLTDEGKPRFDRGIGVDRGPFESIFTYDGSRVFVTNLDANAVTIIDPSSWTAVAVVRDSLRQPHGLALSPDGQVVWVSNRYQEGGAHQHEGHQATGAGTAVALCAATGKVLAELSVGHYAAGISAPVPSTPPPAPRPCE